MWKIFDLLQKFLIVKLCAQNGCHYITTSVQIIENPWKVFSYALPFGLSLGLGILSDLLSLLQLHFYCFYIYAVRLYYFWKTALKSLWLLFFGKKVNPLYNFRIDSINFKSNSQSFSDPRILMGSLIFAIFVFIFPTILVYYSVFALLRVISFTIESVFRIFAEFLTKSLPILSLHFFINPFSYGARLRFDINEKIVKFESLSRSKALEKFSPKVSKQNIFSKIVSGEIFWPSHFNFFSI